MMPGYPHAYDLRRSVRAFGSLPGAQAMSYALNKDLVCVCPVIFCQCPFCHLATSRLVDHTVHHSFASHTCTTTTPRSHAALSFYKNAASCPLPAANTTHRNDGPLRHRPRRPADRSAGRLRRPCLPHSSVRATVARATRRCRTAAGRQRHQSRTGAGHGVAHIPAASAHARRDRAAATSLQLHACR